MLFFNDPVSTLPDINISFPLIASSIENRKGLSRYRLGGMRESNISINEGPLYQGVLFDNYTKLSPSKADVGMKITF